jgi:hypothetical protein
MPKQINVQNSCCNTVKKLKTLGGVKIKNNAVVNFDIPPYIYWSDKTKADYLERAIIIHSIIYYQMSENVISDKMFDNLSKQFLELRNSMQEKEFRQTEYYELFKDFDGNTGFYLYDGLNKKQKKYLTNIANYVLKLARNRGC